MQPPRSAVAVPRAQFDRVLANLRLAGYTLYAPSPRAGRITIREIDSAADLPEGWTDDRTPGRYRLDTSGNEARWFAHSVPPESWKKLLNPARQVLFRSRWEDGRWTIESEREETRRQAFIGIRPCDLAATGILDRVFAAPGHEDRHYAARREGLFVLAAQCSWPADTCFCDSLGSGPVAAGGFDLALWETGDTLVFEVGSARGYDALEGTERRPATGADLTRTRQLADRARRRINRKVTTEGLGEILLDNLEHPRWSEAAARCLACGNCTMVCPTCFCSTVDDEIDPAATRADRVRVWDSCFSTAFSHVHGGNIRPSLSARYRQRITHKFASWKVQFGVSGCVGCGRCITSCPAGIDPCEDLAAIRKGAKS